MATFFKSDSIPAAVADDLTFPRPVNTMVISSGVLWRSLSATAASYTGVDVEGSITIPNGDSLVVEDDADVEFGTGLDFNFSFISASNELRIRGLDVTGGGAGTDTAGLDISTGDYTVNDAVAGVPESGPIVIHSGATDVTTAAGTAGPSGDVTVQTGPTDTNFAGGTGGNSGDLLLYTGNASSTIGTSGDSGQILIRSGTSADGNTGAVICASGTAATGTSGNVRLDTGNATAGDSGDIVLSSGTVITGQTRGVVRLDEPTAVRFNGIDFSTRYVLTEEFAQRTQLVGSFAAGINPNFMLAAGTGSANGNSTLSATGGQLLTTNAVANNQAIIQPITTANQSAWDTTVWDTDSALLLKASIRTGADITDQILAIGLKIGLTLDTGTDADQIWLGYSTAGIGAVPAANFAVVHSAGGVDLQYDTGVVVAAATQYQIVLVEAVTTRIVTVYINGVLVATTAALAANIQTLKPTFGIQTIAGAARTLTVQRVALSRLFE